MKNSLTLHTHLCLLQLLSHSFSIKLGRSISTCQDLQDSSCQPNLWFARRGLQIPIQIDMWRPLLTNKNNTRANVVTNLINLIPLLVYQYLKNRFFLFVICQVLSLLFNFSHIWTPPKSQHHPIFFLSSVFLVRTVCLHECQYLELCRHPSSPYQLRKKK